MHSWLKPDSGSAVKEALGRWTEKGLISPELADTLRQETEERDRASRRRFGQVAVAVTAGVLLLIAAGVFLARAWVELTPAARTGIIAFLAVALHGLGSFLLGRRREPVLARVLQISGLVVLMAAFIHSEEAWADGSGSAVVVGLSALAVPLGLLPRALRSGPVMGATTAALAYGYLAVFLDRALALSDEPLLWVLYGVAVLSVLGVAHRLARPESGKDHPWELPVLVVSLYAGLVLTLLVGLEALDLGEHAVWALDAWLALMVAATLWGIHRAPARLRNAWYPRHLAWAMLLAIPLAFWTLGVALDGSAWLTGAGVAVLGASGLAYALRFGGGQLVIASCLALVVAAWFLGVEVGQAGGVVGALAFTAVLLFWVSTRVGADRSRQ